MVEYNEKEKSLQISVHLFIDDLEESLKKEGHTKLFICTEREATQAEKHIESYLRKNLSFSINGKSTSYTFVGKEGSSDMSAVWIYLEIPVTGKIKTINIKNIYPPVKAINYKKSYLHYFGLLLYYLYFVFYFGLVLLKQMYYLIN
jgi:hypothetical protein